MLSMHPCANTRKGAEVKCTMIQCEYFRIFPFKSVLMKKVSNFLYIKTTWEEWDDNALICKKKKILEYEEVLDLIENLCVSLDYTSSIYFL